MPDDIDKLYAALGYRGKEKAAEEAKPTGEMGAPMAAAPMGAGAAPGFKRGGKRKPPKAKPPSCDELDEVEQPHEPPPLETVELPPLGPDEIEALMHLLDQDPQALVAWYRQTWDADISEADLREALIQAEMAFNAPMAAAQSFEAQEAFFFHQPLPPGFNFPGMDVNTIPINPNIRQFETYADALRWLIFAGPQYVSGGVRPKAPFRWHNHPAVTADFVYDITSPTAEAAVDIALFSDFGTGLYHSRYIAKQLAERRFPYAIHLGDVYYAGRSAEFRDYFEEPLRPLLDHTELFTLNANHEMLSGSFPYFDYIDRRRRNFTNQRQEGSYFCLRNNAFQLVAIDTAYFENRRHNQPGLAEWLQRQLEAGRRAGLVNILLSPDHPYEYGKHGLTPLLESDLREVVLEKKLVDLWFWGNTHYCALFSQTAELPFFGSCIGHGGYPYERAVPGQTTAAPPLFLETSPRFPEWTRLRQDRGNNGYCLLTLKENKALTLTYIDWMSNKRFTADFAQDAAGAFVLTASRLA